MTETGLIEVEKVADTYTDADANRPKNLKTGPCLPRVAKEQEDQTKLDRQKDPFITTF